MNFKGVTISGAGSTFVNGDYGVLDPIVTHNHRAWLRYTDSNIGGSTTNSNSSIINNTFEPTYNVSDVRQYTESNVRLPSGAPNTDTFTYANAYTTYRKYLDGALPGDGVYHYRYVLFVQVTVDAVGWDTFSNAVKNKFYTNAPDWALSVLRHRYPDIPAGVITPRVLKIGYVNNATTATVSIDDAEQFCYVIAIKNSEVVKYLNGPTQATDSPSVADTAYRYALADQVYDTLASTEMQEPGVYRYGEILYSIIHIPMTPEEYAAMGSGGERIAKNTEYEPQAIAQLRDTYPAIPKHPSLRCRRVEAKYHENAQLYRFAISVDAVPLEKYLDAHVDVADEVDVDGDSCTVTTTTTVVNGEIATLTARQYNAYDVEYFINDESVTRDEFVAAGGKDPLDDLVVESYNDTIEISETSASDYEAIYEQLYNKWTSLVSDEIVNDSSVLNAVTPALQVLAKARVPGVRRQKIVTEQEVPGGYSTVLVVYVYADGHREYAIGNTYGDEASVTKDVFVTSGGRDPLEPIEAVLSDLLDDAEPTIAAGDPIYLFRDANRGWVLANTETITANTEIYYSEELDADGKPFPNASPWNVKWTRYAGYRGVGDSPTIMSNGDPKLTETVSQTYRETDPDDPNTIYLKKTIIYTSTITGKSFELIRTEASTGVVTRYEDLNVSIGKIYRFSFTKNFESIGYIKDTTDKNYSVTRGIYRVDKILTYSELLRDKIDLYQNLYSPCNVSLEQYFKDEEILTSAIIYKLVDPRNEATVYYMPLPFIDGTPDASIAMYDAYLLVIKLGIFSDKAMIRDMIGLLEELLEAKWGISKKDPQFKDDMVSLQIYDSTWLTTEEYAAINRTRDVYKKEAKNNLLQDIFYSKENALVEENTRLKSKVSAYEDIISNQVESSNFTDITYDNELATGEHRVLTYRKFPNGTVLYLIDNRSVTKEDFIAAGGWKLKDASGNPVVPVPDLNV